MKLFNKAIDNLLFKQYRLGSDLENQKVVAKIFNPYGAGRWYLMNSDPNDPNYLWGIVEMGGEVEMGSISRNELESIRLTPMRLKLERDLGFTPINALELYNGLREGKFYKKGGMTSKPQMPVKTAQNSDGDLFGNSTKLSHDEWEDRLTDELGELMGATRSDAQGIVEAQNFYVAQAWGLGLSPKDAARHIMSKIGMAQGGVVNTELNLFAKAEAQKKGVTQKELGSDYPTALAQALVSGLSDANFHSEAKQIVSGLENEDWSDDLYKSVYYNPTDEVNDLGVEVSKKSEWDGFDVAMAFKYLAQMSGNHKLAKIIDKVFEKYMAKGGQTDTLEKELFRLQRDLNSRRLSTYREGDNSEDEMARQRERASKLERFNEVLRLLRERDANSKMAEGGETSGKNGYIAFYKGKRIEVYANTMYEAQKIAAKKLGAKKEWEVNVVLAEVDGKPYIHSTSSFESGGDVDVRMEDTVQRMDDPNFADPSYYKDGGIVMGGFRKNIMGTLSFDLKMGNMRKSQDFIVYPVSKGDTEIKIQSDTRIGKIDMVTGQGKMSQSHQTGAYGHHLMFDKLIDFQLPADELLKLKVALGETAGREVGSRGVISNNEGAADFMSMAGGGEIKKEDIEILGVPRNKITQKEWDSILRMAKYQHGATFILKDEKGLDVVPLTEYEWYVKEKMASGGVTSDTEVVNYLKSVSGLRASYITEWAEKNNVDLNKVQKAIKSKDLKPIDFSTAVSGKDGNKYAREVITKYGGKMESGGETGWNRERKSVSEEGSVGNITFNGKVVAEYEYDRDSDAFWIETKNEKGEKFQKAFNEITDVYEYLAKKNQMAGGGQVDKDMEEITDNVKLFHKYKFDSDVAASNDDNAASIKLFDKAEKYRDKAVILINNYNKNKKTNFAFQDFKRDGKLKEGISSGLSVPTEYTNPAAEEGRWTYLVEVKHPYRKEVFITNYSTEEKHRDPSYQAALNVIKEAQKNDDFVKGHIMSGFYIKGLGRSYYTVFSTDKKTMKSGGQVKQGDYVIVDNPNWQLTAPFKPVRRKVKMVDKDVAFFSDGSNSQLKYVKKLEQGGTAEEVNQYIPNKTNLGVYFDEGGEAKSIMSFEEFKKKLPVLHDVKWGDKNVEYKAKYNHYSGTTMYFKHGRSNSEKVSLAEAYKHYKHYAEKGEEYENGGDTNPKIYIEYLNKRKNFSRDKKYFKTQDEAIKWGRKNLPNFNMDMLRYEYAKGGKVKFSDKVKSISTSLLKRKKVPKSVQKDYGKTFSKAEALDSAKRIAGAMRKKEMAKKKS